MKPALYCLIFLTAVLSTMPIPARAAVDAQLLLGQRWYELGAPNSNSSFGVSALAVDLSGHVAPLALVPISIGAGATFLAPRKEDFGDNVSSAKGWETSIEVMAWVPQVPIITPFARLKYPLLSRIEYKGTVDLGAGSVSEEAKLDLSGGYQIDFGIRYPIIPAVSVIVEAGLGFQKWKFAEYKIDGQSEKIGVKESANSKSLLIGTQLEF